MSYELSLLLNYFVVFIEVLAFMVFSGAFFQKKITSSKFILSTVVLTGLNFICLAISESNVLFKLVLLTCVDSLWLVVIYRVPSIKCIAISVLFSSFINIADNFFFMAITILKNITMQELYRDPYGYYLICYIAKIFEILLFTIFKSAVKQRFYFHHTTWKHWLKIFVLPIVSMFISVFLWHLYWIVPFAAREILFCTIALFIMNAFAFVTLNYLDREQQLIQDNTVLTQNIKYQNDIVEAWATAYKNQRKMTHDFQNHLCVLQSLISKNANEDAMKLLNQLTMETKENVQILRTGNNFIDAILNFKYTSCSKENIWMIFEINNLSNLSLPTDKIIVILSNLLDNAIEACLELESERYIKIKFLVGKDIMLSIKNTTNRNLISKDNMMTIKENKILHGYGLKNIERAVKETGGISTVNCKDGWFQYTILWTCC